MNHDTVAHHACAVDAVNLAFCNHTSGNGAHLRDLVDLAHLNLSCDNLLLDLVEHTLHGRSDIVDGVVDDRVGVNLHASLVSLLACGSRRTHLEAHDDGIGSVGERHIAL